MKVFIGLGSFQVRHIYHILIHTENKLINNMLSNRENIDTTVQGPELQCFLKVSRP